jgi:hypothetical protein
VRFVKRWWVAVAVLLLAACSGQTGSTTPTAATPADYGVPPAGVPLVYVGDPNHAGWYIGVDWTGRPRGTLKLSAPLGPAQTLLPAPDGSAFMIPPFKGLRGAFLDRLGRPIADSDLGYERMTWADDSAHVCTLDYRDRQWHIGLKTPGTTATVHPVAIDPSVVQSGIIAIQFAACSAANDRAVLAYNYFGRPTELYVVRISDATVLLHQSHPAGVLAGITASEDATLIAENSSKSSGYLMGAPAANTIVRRVSGGSVLAKLDPSFGVVAFSRDDSLALVSTSPLAAEAPTNVALVRLADGAVLWHQETSEPYGGRWVRPDGSDIAIQLGPPAGSGRGPVSVVIVHPDGTSTSRRFD